MVMGTVDWPYILKLHSLMLCVYCHGLWNYAYITQDYVYINHPQRWSGEGINSHIATLCNRAL